MGKSNHKTACVFGLFETGLGVIRSLGKEKIKVFGIDYKKDIAWYSKYTTPMLSPDPRKNEPEFIDWLKDKFNNFDQKIPAFITGDDFLEVFAKHRDLLNKYFIFNLSTTELLEKISNKFSQYNLANEADIPVPETWLIDDKISINKLKSIGKWPLFIKGKNVNEWRMVYGGTKKGFVVSDFNQFLEVVEPAINKSIPVIAQEIIEGDDDKHFKYCVYVGVDGEILAEFCLQKIRQNPVHFGIGSSVCSIENPELLETGRKFVKAINYKGIGSAEFKFDENDKKYKLIELNPRYWQQNYLTTACNINFAFINYLDLTGEKLNIQHEYKTGVKWINFFSDFNSFLSYRKTNKLNFINWYKSLTGPKVFSNFKFSDPIPMLKELEFGKRIFKIPMYLFKRIYK